jgi:hypothetical protein
MIKTPNLPQLQKTSDLYSYKPAYKGVLLLKTSNTQKHIGQVHEAGLMINVAHNGGAKLYHADKSHVQQHENPRKLFYKCALIPAAAQSWNHE